MRGRHRIPPRTIKRFLQLAAATFAIGLGATPARADGEDRGFGRIDDGDEFFHVVHSQIRR